MIFSTGIIHLRGDVALLPPSYPECFHLVPGWTYVCPPPDASVAPYLDRGTDAGLASSAILSDFDQGRPGCMTLPCCAFCVHHGYRDHTFWI